MSTDKDSLTKRVMGVVEGLNEGFSYETNEDGDYYDSEGYGTSPYTWLEDALDIEVRCGLDGEYRGARVLVAFGGPTIWVDTRGVVDGAWWFENYSALFSGDVANELDEAISEYWQCR